MFESLYELPLSRLTSGVHHAIRLLSHSVPIVGDVSPIDEWVASRIFDEINAVEGTSWRPGQSDVVDKYIRMLSEIVLTRTKKELGTDPERGRKLLDRVRERYVIE